MDLISLLNATPEQLFRGFFLPFILLFAITWGVLTSLKIFNRNVNLVISLALTILVATTPQFTLFATYITQLGGQFVLIAFVIVFGVGVLMWALGRGRDIFYEQVAPSKKLEKLVKEKAKYLQKAKEAKESGDNRKSKEYLRRAREKEDEIELESES